MVESKKFENHTYMRIDVQFCIDGVEVHSKSRKWKVCGWYDSNHILHEAAERSEAIISVLEDNGYIITKEEEE